MYKIYFDGTLFPVAPPKISTKINGRNNTIELINEGEVNVIKTAGLTDIEVELLLPNQQYPFALYAKEFKTSTYFLERLELLKQSTKPFTFIVTRTTPKGDLMFDTNMLVSIEDYEIVEDVEELGLDVKVVVALKQYKHYGNKRLKIEQPKAQTSTKSTKKTAKVEKARDTSTKKTPKTHKVVKGDTLWSIAKKHLGDGSKYKQLAKLNNIKNPNVIKVGQVIKLE